MGLLEQHHAGFAAEIDLPLFINDHTYMPKPPLEAERIKIWYHYIFIPYILTGKMHVFMGPLTKYIKKPQLLEDFFPIYHGHELLVFIYEPLKFKIFKNCVFCSSSPTTLGNLKNGRRNIGPLCLTIR